MKRFFDSAKRTTSSGARWSVRVCAGWMMVIGCVAGAAPADDGRVRELWVPTPDLGVVLERMPEAMMLERAEFDRLWSAAGEGWWRTSDPNAGEPLLVRGAKGVLRDLGEQVQLEMGLEIESKEHGWNVVRLDLPVDQIVSVRMKGGEALQAALVRGMPPMVGVEEQAKEEPRQEQGMLLLARGEGMGVLEVKVLLPVVREGTLRRFTVPPCPAPRGALGMERDAAGVIGPALRQVRTGIVAAWDGTRGGQEWRLVDEVLPEFDENNPGLANELAFVTILDVSPDRARCHVQMNLRDPFRGVVDELRVRLPEGSSGVRVRGRDVRDWDLFRDQVEIRLQSRVSPGVRTSASLAVVYELPLNKVDEQGMTGFDLNLPEVEGYERIRGRLQLAVGDGLGLVDVNVEGGRDLRWNGRLPSELNDVDPDGVGAAMENAWASWATFDGKLGTVRVEARREQQVVAADLDTRIGVTRDGVMMERHLMIRPREGDVVSTELTLPQGEELWKVEWRGDDADKGEWRLEDSVLTLRWPGGVSAGETAKAVISSMRDRERMGELGVEAMPLQFESAEVAGVERLAGYVAVDFDPEFRVQALEEEGLERREAATSPIAGRLAWFRLADYLLGLEVERLAPQVTARVIQHALPLAGRLDIEGGLEVDVAGSGLRKLSVELDPALAESLRWDSELISEQRLEPGSGRWTLTFSEEIMGSRLLRWRMSLAHSGNGDSEGEARFSNRLPVLTVPSARRLEGHLVVEANTDTELGFEATGLEPLDLLEVPTLPGYQPRHRAVAAYRFRGGDWELELIGVRHEPKDLSTLAIPRMDLVTVLGEEAPIRHSMSLELLASGEQFAGFRLPTGSRILSLVVNDQPARPVDGGKGLVRVQLPPSREGGVRCRIRMVWEQPATEGGKRRISLEPPLLPEGAEVLASSWRLYAPDGYRYEFFESNLKAEFETVRIGPGQWLKDLLQIAVPVYNESVSAETAATYDVWEEEKLSSGSELAEDTPEMAAEPEEPTAAEPEEPTDEDALDDAEQAAQLPQSDAMQKFGVDRAGMQAIDLEVPKSGRVFEFSGYEAPANLEFSRRSWAGEIRWAWVMIVFGVLLFVRLARRRPWVYGLLGIVLLAFLPVVLFGEAKWPWFNGLLLGWLAAMAVKFGLGLIALGRRIVGGRSLAATGWGTAVLVGVFPWPVTGEDLVELPEPPAAHAAPLIVVPFDPGQGVEVVPDRPVYLDRDIFERLWRAAGRGGGEADDPGPIPGVVARGGAAFYELELGRETVLVRARYEVVTREPWTTVPLPIKEKPLTRLTLDGRETGLGEHGVLVEEPGLHVVEFTMTLNPGLGWKSLSMPLAAGGWKGLSMTAAADWEGDLKIEGGPALLEQPQAAGGRSWTAALGALENLTLRRLPGRGDAGQGALAGVDLRGRLDVSADRAIYGGQLRYRFPGRRRDFFSFEIGGGWELAGLPVGRFKAWAIRANDDGSKTIEFTLPSKAEDVVEIGFQLVATDPPALPAGDGAAALMAPLVKVGAARMSRQLEIVAGPEARIVSTNGNDAGWRRVAVAEDVADRATAYVSEGEVQPLQLELAGQALERSLEMELVYQIGRSQLETIAVMDFEQRDADLVSVAIELEAGQVIQDVQSRTLSDWFRVGDTLVVRMMPGTRGRVPVMVYLSEPREVSEPIKLSPPKVRDWSFKEGVLSVVAHAGDEVAIESADDAAAVEEIGVDDERVQAVQLVAPYERKRSYAFREQGFDLITEVAAIDAQIEAGWTQLVEARGGYATMRGLIDLQVKRGAVDRMRVRLPQGLGMVEAEGPLVREVRSVGELDDGKMEVYEILFQRDVLDGTRVELAMELPYRGDASDAGTRWLDLPLPQVEAELTGDRFLLLSFLTRDEVKLSAPGAREVPLEEVPVLPEGFSGERALAFQPGRAEARLELEELSTTAGRDAVVTLAELDSAVRENGDVWTTATYQLLNRSLQFLPVDLPTGSVLLSVRVDGVGVRADRTEGESGFLIPLIQTDPGQLAVPVEVTYRQSTGQRLEGSAELVLDDPDLPGVSVQKTLWNVWLPDDFRMVERDGNMEPVTVELTKREKISAAMGELGRLNRVIEKGSGYGYRTRSKALRNAQQLQQQIASESADLGLRSGSRSGGKGPDQGADVQSQLDSLSVTLTENRIQLTEELEGVTQDGADEDWDDDGTKPWSGWFYNGIEVKQRDLEQRQENEQWRQDIDEQLLLNDNAQILRERLEGDVKMGDVQTPKKGKINDELRYAGDAIANTSNARGQEAAITGRQYGRKSVDDLANREDPSAEPVDRLEGPADAPLRGQDFRTQNRPDNPSMPQQSEEQLDASGLAGSGEWTRGGGLPQAPIESLRGVGQVSLQLDIPRAGEAIHYRKNGDHARLEIRMREDTESPRALGLIGLVLGLIGWAVVVRVIPMSKRNW